MTAETTLARSFDDLAKLAEGTPGLRVRIHRADGSAIEGQVFSVGSTDLFMLDNATRQPVQVFAHELHALDVSRPRRGREWALAAAAIPLATAALIGYTRLPWVQPGQSDVVTAMVILTAIAAAVMSLPLVRRWRESWLMTWQRVYPPLT